jgi:peptide/nickel transport system substrate-binding protein
MRGRTTCCAVAALVALACRSEPRLDPPRPKPVESPEAARVVVGISAPPASLDPHRLNEFLTFDMLSNVYEGLVGLDASLRVEPVLAVSWSSTDDRHWRFELRSGVTFHDGRPLTAADVVSSLQRARTHPRSQFKSYLVDMADVRAVGELVVEVTTLRPNPVLLNQLAFVLIVPRDAPEEIDAPVGTGPYRLGVADKGRTIELSAFERYWGPPPAQREVRYVARGARPPSARLLEGEVDLLMDLAPEEAVRIRATPGFKVVAEPAPAVDVLALRVDTAPFKDRRVRRALHLAIDRPRLVEGLLHGFGRPASQLVSRNVFGFDPGLSAPTRDVAAARRLLKEAGHPDGLDLVLEHRRERRVDVIVAQLAEAGIRVRPVAQHWHALLDRLEKGQVPFAFTGLVSDSGESSDVFLSTLHTRQPGRGLGDSNARGYSNAHLDALIERAAQTPTPNERLTVLQHCMRLAMEDLPLVPLAETYLIYGLRDDLTWTVRADGRLLARDLHRLPGAGHPLPQ